MMSTNTTTLPKAVTALIFASGFYLFFGTLVLAPFVNITLFATFHSTTKLAILMVGALLVLIQLFFLVPVIRKNIFSSIPKFVKVTAVIAVITFALSIIFSASLKTSIFGMFGAWEYNVMTFLLIGIVGVGWWELFVIAKLYKFEQTLFRVLISITLVVTIIYGLGDYYFWHLHTTYVSNGIVRLTLGFTNPLFAAYFIGMLWAYQFSTVLDSTTTTTTTAKNASIAIGQLLLFAGITHLLLLTFTRSAWISAGISAFIILAWAIWKNYKNKLHISRTITTLFLLVVIILAQVFAYLSQILERNTDLRNESTQTLTTIASSLGNSEDTTAAMSFFQNAQNYTSGQIRLLEWQWGIRTWSANPKNFLFGVGPDAAFFEMPKTRDPIFNDLPTDSTVKPYYIRNLYLNFLLQHGFLASISVTLLLLFLAYLLIRHSFTEPQTIAILVAYLAQGIFYYPTILTTVLLVFFLAYQIAKFSDIEKSLLRTPNTLERVLVILLAVGIALWGFFILKAEFTLKIYNATMYPPTEKEMAKNSLIPISNNVLKRYFTYYYYSSELGQKYLKELEKSNDIDDLRVTADAYYLWARKDNSIPLAQKSIATLERLLTIEDTLPSTWDALGLRYLYIHDYDKAMEKFQQTLKLKNDYWYSYLHIGETLRQQCKPQEALNWYEKAKPYVPSTEKEIMETKAEIEAPREDCK